MTIEINHEFVSAKADGTDSTLVQPSNWNDDHIITMAAGKIMGRDTSGAGAVQELGLAFDASNNADFNVGTGFLTWPRGTTAQRPGTPVVGMVRYNTTAAQFEGYDSSASWQRLMTANAVTAAINAATASISGLLYGLTLSTAGSSATFGVAAGRAVDTTAASLMVLGSAFTKTTSAWALGTGNGALDTGAIANSTWYHVFLIQRVDTSVVDVLISASATAPTMPTNYTLFRRIGSMKTNGSAQWVKFIQTGDRFDILAATDYTVVGSFAATLRTLNIPLGIVTTPLCYITSTVVNNVSTSVQFAPAADATLLQTVFNTYEGDAVAGSGSSSCVEGPPSNTSSQIYVAVPFYGGNAAIQTMGWIDRRGRDG